MKMEILINIQIWKMKTQLRPPWKMNEIVGKIDNQFSSIGQSNKKTLFHMAFKYKECAIRLLHNVGFWRIQEGSQ